MFGTYFYHERLRKAVATFGALFNDLYVLRRNTDGHVINTQKVPLSYGPRQKFLDRIVYLKDTNEVWDLVNQKTYSLDSINFEYAKLFSKITPMHFLKKNPTTKIVEGFIG